MPSSVLLHIPHSSTAIPPDLRASFLLSDHELEFELMRMTDRYTDELFDVPGVDRLVFPISRLVVDPERFRDDAVEPMSERGMGAVYVLTHDGRPLKAIPNREALLRRYYDPHHEALGRWAQEALHQHGKALIVDCHSFPSEPLPCDLSQVRPRPAMNIGTDDFHTPPELAQYLEKVLEAAGWTVGMNWPYSGTMAPTWAWQRDRRVRSVMVEVRRGLYMDEESGDRNRGFEMVRNALSRILAGASELPATG